MVSQGIISALFLALLSLVAVSSASVSGSWANPRGDTSHTGFASVVSPSYVPEGNWSAVVSSTSNVVYANPAVDNFGNIYYMYTTNDRMTSRVVSFTPGGVLRWNATVQLTSATTLLYSLQTNSIIVVGQPIYLGYTAVWTVSTSGVAQAGGLLPGTASIPSILSSSESALYTAIGVNIYKTDLAGQRIIWSSPMSTNATDKVFVLSITPDGQSLIATAAACSFCSENLYVYGVDTATGKTLWQNTQDAADYFPFNAVYNPVSNLWIVDNWKSYFAAISPVNGSVMFNFTAEGLYCGLARLGAIDPVSGQIYATCGYYYTSFDVSGRWLWNGGQVIGNYGGIIPSLSVRSPYNAGSPVVFGTGAQSNGYLWGFYPNGKLACQIAVQTSPLRNLIDTFIIGQNVYVRYYDSSNNNVLRCYSLDW